MGKILNIKEAVNKSKALRNQGKTIVLTGGCFDILHIGHFSLLKHAKNEGEILMVLLESDAKIQKLKGLKRPLHSQKERAEMLVAIKYVDYVVLLPNLETNEEYDSLIEKIKPNVLAITQNDPNKIERERQAKRVHAIVKEVIPYLPDKSTSATLKILLKEN